MRPSATFEMRPQGSYAEPNAAWELTRPIQKLREGSMLGQSLGFQHFGIEPQAIRIGDTYYDGYLMSRGGDPA